MSINNPDASVGVCCSHKVVAVGFNTLRYDASVGVLNPPHESMRKILDAVHCILVAVLEVSDKQSYQDCRSDKMSGSDNKGEFYYKTLFK